MQATGFLALNEKFEMKITTLGMFVLFFSNGLSAQQSRISGELYDLVAQGIDLTLKQEYKSADSVFRIVVVKYPHYPIGFLYRAAVMQTEAIDYLDPLNLTVFDSLLALATSEAQKLIDESPDSPMGYYFLGTATGYDAYARVEAGNWFAGITKGLSAASDFKKSVELDSTFYDAYVGVGTYYYWKSRKAEFLNWALGDRRPEGIDMLETAAAKGDLNRFTALSALTTIFLDSHQYDQAIQCAKHGLKQYPQNRIFLWGLAAAQEQSGKYEDVLQTYHLLLTSILDARMSNPYNEILSRLNTVKAHIALKQTDGLQSQIDAILLFEHHRFPENLAQRAKDKFEQARNIRAQLVVK